MTLRQLLALFRRMLVADMTPPADRAEVARAGDVHSRKAVVEAWADKQLARREWFHAYRTDVFRALDGRVWAGIAGETEAEVVDRLIEVTR